MDIFKDKRNHTQGGTKHINKPTTHEERTQRKHFVPFLFAYSPKGKKKTQQHTQRATKTTQIDKAGKEDKQSRKAGKEEEKQAQKDKKRGKHASSL